MKKRKTNPLSDIFFDSNEYQAIQLSTGNIYKLGKQEYLFLHDLKYGTSCCDWSTDQKEKAYDFFKSTGVITEAEHNLKPRVEGLMKIKLAEISVDTWIQKIYRSFSAVLPFATILLCISWSILIGHYIYVVTVGLPSFITPKLSMLEEVALIALLELSLLVHECGHMLMCYHYLGEVGKVGLMLFFVQPTLYCNLTCTYFLDKRKRINIYLAGINAQVFLMALLCLIEIFLGKSFYSIEWFIIVDTISVVVNLIPFVKFDGYWVVSSIVGDKNLYTHAIQSLFINHTSFLLSLFGFLAIVTEVIVWSLMLYAVSSFLNKFCQKPFSIIGIILIASIILIDVVRRYKKISSHIS